MINRQLKFAEAIHEAIDICLDRDRSTYLMGLGVPDPIGVFGTTKGLQEKHGKKRVFDMPVAENAMTGVALGSCLVGMRPIMTHMRLEFAMTAMDQICNQAAKWHYMFGGQSKVPLTIRMLIGRGWGQGPQHSQSLHAWFAHIPGLKVVMPSTPYDAKGLLIASIEDDNPVVFFEHRWLHNIHGPVPEGHYTVPLGEPRIVTEGGDVTIVAASYATLEAIKAGRELEREGIKAEIIDLRTLVPRNDAAILELVRKTGRLVVVDQGTLTGGFAGEIVARVTEEAFDALRAAPIRVRLPDIPTPTTRALSNYYYPTPGHIVAAARRTLGLIGARCGLRSLGRHRARGQDAGRAGQVVHRTILMFAFDASFWRDRRVFVTGHTGFKGAWLSLWLTGLGARVTGLSLPPQTDPSLFALCAGGRCTDLYGDVADPTVVARALEGCEPEIVIHMAAEALVRPSYLDSLGTFATNVMGTANVLQAVRSVPTVRAASW